MICFSQVSSMSLLGQCGAFARRHHPADHVAAEDVEDDVEVEVGPLGGTAQFGDVPAPQLVGRGGQQLRLLVLGMGELIARSRVRRLVPEPDTWFAWSRDTGLHRATWPELAAGAQSWKRVGIEHGAHRFALFGTQRPGRSRAQDRRARAAPDRTQAGDRRRRAPRRGHRRQTAMPTVGANCWTASIKASRPGLACGSATPTARPLFFECR